MINRQFHLKKRGCQRFWLDGMSEASDDAKGLVIRR